MIIWHKIKLGLLSYPCTPDQAWPHSGPWFESCHVVVISVLKYMRAVCVLKCMYLSYSTRNCQKLSQKGGGVDIDVQLFPLMYHIIPACVITFDTQKLTILTKYKLLLPPLYGIDSNMRHIKYRTSSVWWHHGFLQIITVVFYRLG